MSGPIIVRKKGIEIDEEFPRRSSRARVSRAVVIEGEAPETDDEFSVEVPSTSATAPSADPTEEVAIPQRARVHVDEKLEQRWRKLGEDVLATSVKRIQPTIKMTNDMETCLDNTLASIQGASGHIRHASTVVYHLEDSVEALLDAAKLIPTSFENTVRVTRLK